jgi:hypothetical protein
MKKEKEQKKKTEELGCEFKNESDCEEEVEEEGLTLGEPDEE